MASKNSKSLNCKYCGTQVNNVGIEAVAVVCWKCTMAMVDGKEPGTLNDDKIDLLITKNDENEI